MKKLILGLILSVFVVSYVHADTRGWIGKEDAKIYDGKTTTFTRRTTSGTGTFNKIDWAGVDVLMVYGNGTERTDTTLRNALGAIGTARTVEIWLSPGRWAIENDLDASSYTNVWWRLASGAYFSGDGTLTIYRKSHILNNPGDTNYDPDSIITYSEAGAVYYDSTDSITFLGGVGAASRYSAMKVTMSGSGKDGIYADSINQEAVLGRSTYGTGVYGIHSSAGVGGPGVFGSSNGTFGVYGWSRGDTGGTTSAGVYGESVDSIGGYFYADDNIGCQGHAGVYEAGRFIRQGGPTTQVTGTGGVAKYIHDHNVNLRPVVEIMKDTEPQLKADNNRNDHSPVLFVNDMTDVADDDTSIGEQGLILDIRHGDDTRVGGHTKQTLDNEAALNKGGGLVGIQLDDHGYSSGDRIVIRGTVEYDDVYTVDATTTEDEIVIGATYWPEVIPATATVSLARERKLFNIDEQGIQTSRRKTYATNAMIGDTGVKYWVYCGDVTDAGTVILPSAIHGHGMISAAVAAGGSHMGTFVVASDGSVAGTQIAGTCTFDNTGAGISVYDGGTSGVCINKSGGTLQFLITFWYEE